MFWEVDRKIKQNDAREGIICKFLPKFTKNTQNCAKTSPLFGYKTLVLLKKRSKSTFQPMKVCNEWVYLKHSEWILSVFMQFDEGLDDF